MFGYRLVSDKHKLVMKPNCIICGRKFYVTVRLKDGKIETNCFHSKLHKRYFLKWTYELDNNFLDNFGKPWYKRLFIKEKVHFDKKFSRPLWLWKTLGCCRPMRWLVYNIWMLIFGWSKIEYWECPRCANRKDDA